MNHEMAGVRQQAFIFKITRIHNYFEISAFFWLKEIFSLADMIVEYANDDCRVSDLASQPAVLQMNVKTNAANVLLLLCVILL